MGFILNFSDKITNMGIKPYKLLLLSSKVPK